MQDSDEKKPENKMCYQLTFSTRFARNIFAPKTVQRVTLQNGAKWLQVPIQVPVLAVGSLTLKYIKETYVHVTVHRNKFLYNNTK